MIEKEIIKKYLSEIAKKARKNNPKPREYYQAIQKLAVKKRLQNKGKKESNLTK